MISSGRSHMPNFYIHTHLVQPALVELTSCSNNLRRKNMEGTNDSPESFAPFCATGDLPVGLLWVWSVGGEGLELDLALRRVASGGTGALALRVSPPRNQMLA